MSMQSLTRTTPPLSRQRAILILLTLVFGPVLLASEAFAAGKEPPHARSLLIMLPGYLGSSIFSCDTHEAPLTKCLNIYGTEASHSHMRDLAIKPHAIYKYDVIDLASPPFDAYRRLGSHIRKTSQDLKMPGEAMTFRPLAYDWREQTRTSAAYLGRQICTLTQAQDASDLYFIAHSMGGLVLKHWLRSELPKQCGGTRHLRVRSIAFIGTPHLGAPKSIEAIQNGVALLPWYDVRGLFERVSATLSQSVLWFPSSYELLPIMESRDCRSQLDKEISKRLRTIDLETGRTAATAAGAQMPDFHSMDVWSRLDLLRFLRERNYQLPPWQFIKERLADARESICGLAVFNPNQTVEELPNQTYFSVLYVVGLMPRNTTSLRAEIAHGGAKLRWTTGAGDGSVPTYSARNSLVATDGGQVITVTGDEGEHLAVVTSQPVLTIIDSWLTQIGVEHTKAKLLKKEGGPPAAEAPSPGSDAPPSGQPTAPAAKTDAQLPELLPLLPNPETWNDPGSLEINKHNNETLKRVQLEPEEYRTRLSSSEKSYLKLVRLSTVAALFPDKSIQRAEALVDGAELAVDLQQIITARKFAIAASNAVIGVDWSRAAAVPQVEGLHRRIASLANSFRQKEDTGDILAAQALVDGAGILSSAIAVASNLPREWPRFADADRKILLRVAEIHPLGYPTVEAMVRMGKKLEALTKGRITIQVYPSTQVGSEKEIMEQMQAGVIAIARIPLSSIGPLVPELGVFSLPFMFRDNAHLQYVLDGPIGDEMLKKVTGSKANLVGLSWMNAGARNLYNSKWPIKSVNDLKGLKIRMTGNPVFVDTMKALGGTGVTMGYDDLVNALQTGAIDGAEGNFQLYPIAQHYRHAKYYSLTGHQIVPELLVFSKKVWNTLSSDDQALLLILARETQREEHKLWSIREWEAIKQIKDAGGEIVHVVDKKSFQDAVKPVWEKYAAQYADLIGRIQEAK